MKRFLMYGIPKSLLIKIIIALFILLMGKNVFAAEFNMNNYTSASLNGTKNRYLGTEIYNTGTANTYTFGTRYSGKLSAIDAYFDYPFEANKTYRLTYNMATEDFRNNFGGKYWWDCSQTMTASNQNIGSLTYVSYKKVQFTFTPTDNTTCIRVLIGSSSLSSSAITGVSNWKLDSITLYDPDYQSGSSGGQGSSPTPTPTPNTNQDIINNQNNNTQDIINNQNNNTQDIIENNNQNTQDIINSQNDLLKSCIKNLIDICNPNDTSNSNSTCNGSQLTTNFTANWGMVGWVVNAEPNTTYTFQYDSRPDNNTYARIEEYHNNTLINTVFNDFTGTRKTFTTNSNTNKIRLIFFRSVSGSGVEFNEIQLINSFTISPYIYYDNPVCSNKLDDTTNAINNLNDTMKDETQPTIDINVDVASDTPIIDLIYMPLTILGDLLDHTGETCQPYSIPFDFSGGNNTLNLPCINLKSLLGNDFYNILNALISFYMAYNIGLMCVTIYNDITSLRDTFSGLYERAMDEYHRKEGDYE